MDPYSWALHWDVLGAIAGLAALYYAAQRRWPSDTPRRVAFDIALILLLAVYVTPLHTIALHYLLSVHFLQNVVTAEWAPGLVVLAVAPVLGRKVGRYIHPLVALPLWLATYFVWHVPAIYDAALEGHGALLHLEHLTYFLAGLLLWWPVVHGRFSDGAKALYLFAGFVLCSPLGLLLALLPRPVYDFYKDAPQLWGLSDLTDQQIAGVTMAAEQAVVFFAVFVYYLLRFLRTEHITGVFSESSR
ncbi:MAG: cytochrome c oxidase assembly protein [Gaiellaceae bacterium]